MSLYKRENGFWYVDIVDSRIPGNGRISVSAKTKRKAEADKRHAAICTLIEQGETALVTRIGKPRAQGGIDARQVQMAVADGDLDGLREVSGVGPAMIGQAVDRLIALTRATRERGTLEVYVSVLRNLESHFGVSREKGGAILNDAPLSSVMMDDIQRWLYGPKETNGGNPWSPRRQDVARSLAGKLFRIEIVRSQERAEMTGGRQEIRRNPVEAVGRPRIRQTRVAFLSPVEWRRLIEAAEDRPVAAALGLWCLAGLRLMEAAHIRTDIDIALTGNTPHIEIQPRDGEYPWKAKTDRSNRRIPLIKGSELHRILERHVDLGYAGDRYFIRPANADRPYGPIGLRKIARKAFEAAGIKWGGQGDALTVHSLRHTFVSWLVQQDVQAMKIAKLIGDRPEQVYQTYGHLLPEDLNAVVSIIDRVAEGK